MSSSLFFLLVFFVCIIGLTLIPKNEQKISVIRSLVGSYIISLCLGCAFAFFMKMLQIPVHLTVMSAFYLFVNLGLFFVIIRKKQVQRLCFDCIDLVTVFLLATVIAIAVWRIFGFELKLNYFSTDTYVHFGYAMTTVRTGTVLSMYFAELYNAMFIELLRPLFTEAYYYKSFIIAECVSNFMTGFTMYMLLRTVVKQEKYKKWLPIVSLLYFVGWPLYNFSMGGFVYWGVSMMLITFGLYILVLTKDVLMHRRMAIGILFLLLFCIAQCYMLFVPFVFILFFAGVLYLYKGELSRIGKQKICMVSISALIVGVVAFLSAFFTYFNGDINRFLNSIRIDGGIYRNLYRDFIYFVPIILFGISNDIKKKRVSIIGMTFLIYLFLVCGCLGLVYLGGMSTYYFYKLYFVLWLLNWVYASEIYIDLSQELKRFLKGYFVILICLAIYSFTPLETIGIEKRINDGEFTEFPMYSALGSYIKNPRQMGYDENFMEIVKYGIEKEEAIPLVGDTYDSSAWYSAMTGNQCLIYSEVDELMEEFVLQKYSDTTEFAFVKDSTYYSEGRDLLDQQYETAFENDFAVIYKTN